MVLFVGLGLLVMGMLFYYRTEEETQLHKEGVLTREKARNLWILGAVYLLLSGFSACRIASGNDYWNYTYMFDLIAQGRHVSSEPLFNGFVRVIQGICGYGKENYLVIFGVFSFVTVYFFLRAIYDQSPFLPLSVFLFLANGYYFSSFNSVRYYLALAIALYSIKYIFREEYGKFLLWILLAAGFHKSVLLVIPVYIAAKWVADRKWSFPQLAIGTVLLIALGLSMVLCRDLYRKVIFSFYPYYENSMFDQVDYSLTNIGRCVGTIILALICYKKEQKNHTKYRFYLLLSLGGLLLYTAGAFIPEVSRVAYYLVVPQIIYIPDLLSHLENKGLKRVLTMGVCAVFSVYFYMFLKSAYGVDVRILPYRNWIFQ